MIGISYRAYQAGRNTMEARKAEFKQIRQEAEWLFDDIRGKEKAFPNLDAVMENIDALIQRCDEEIEDADEWLKVMYALENQKAGCGDDME